MTWWRTPEEFQKAQRKDGMQNLLAICRYSLYTADELKINQFAYSAKSLSLLVIHSGFSAPNKLQRILLSWFMLKAILDWDVPKRLKNPQQKSRLSLYSVTQTFSKSYLCVCAYTQRRILIGRLNVILLLRNRQKCYTAPPPALQPITLESWLATPYKIECLQGTFIVSPVWAKRRSKLNLSPIVRLVL